MPVKPFCETFKEYYNLYGNGIWVSNVRAYEFPLFTFAITCGSAHTYRRGKYYRSLTSVKVYRKVTLHPFV